MTCRKIVIIGGGSYTWGPTILRPLLTSEYLAGSHVVLHDINAQALDLLHALALRLRDACGSATTVEQTTDLAQALPDADYVLVTISTGGLRAMRADLEIPEQYGVFQTVGDTVGPGGLSRTLRNVPVFLEVAREMERLCPDAWMFNFSNPLAQLTRAVTRETSIRAAGMCHGVGNVASKYASFFDVPIAECSYVNTGLDHCSWFTEFLVRGQPAMKLLEARGIEAWLSLPPAEAAEDDQFSPLYSLRCGLLVGRMLGALPAIGDRHMMEFLPGFLTGAENVARHGLVRTSVPEREQYTKDAWSRVEGMLSGEEDLGVAHGVDLTGDSHAFDAGAWMEALEGGAPYEDNLNAPNVGQVPQLPLGPVVETRGIVDGTGLRPLASPLSPALEAIIHPHVLRQEMAVEAAIEGSFDKALAALASDPLVGDVTAARPMLSDLIEGTRQWLPQFPH